MKSLLILLFLFVSYNLLSQIDKNGNPVVKSITVGEIHQPGFKLSVNYYTLINNINNPNSAVFISKSPSNEEIEKAALEMFSYFYLLILNQEVIYGITYTIYPKSTLIVINPKNNESRKFEVNLNGQIVEDRATEIVSGKLSCGAMISNGQLYFNDNKFKIIKREEVDKAVIKIIYEEKFVEKPEGYVLNEFYKLILNESKTGGKFDVFTDTKGKEKEIVILYNQSDSYENVALYQWGRLVLAAGVTSLEDVLLIYSKFRNRVLNDKEIEYISKGFNKEWEK
jgi:hypothetical protein